MVRSLGPEWVTNTHPGRRAGTEQVPLIATESLQRESRQPSTNS